MPLSADRSSSLRSIPSPSTAKPCLGVAIIGEGLLLIVDDRSLTVSQVVLGATEGDFGIRTIEVNVEIAFACVLERSPLVRARQDASGAAHACAPRDWTVVPGMS
jgi:hypothetical protein